MNCTKKTGVFLNFFLKIFASYLKLLYFCVRLTKEQASINELMFFKAKLGD